MSRTFRRRNTTQNGMWSDLEYFTSDWVRIEYELEEYWSYRLVRVPFPKNSKEYKKGKARFHSDGGTTSFKEPGPSWFRNCFTERPQRRAAKREIQKFMQNPDYEPMILPKNPLEYWT